MKPTYLILAYFSQMFFKFEATQWRNFVILHDVLQKIPWNRLTLLCVFFLSIYTCMYVPVSQYYKTRSRSKIFPWNQIFRNFFSKNVDLTEKMIVFPQNSWSHFIVLFNAECFKDEKKLEQNFSWKQLFSEYVLRNKNVRFTNFC